jgi:hypothetical protein
MFLGGKKAAISKFQDENELKDGKWYVKGTQVETSAKEVEAYNI